MVKQVVLRRLFTLGETLDKALELLPNSSVSFENKRSKLVFVAEGGVFQPFSVSCDCRGSKRLAEIRFAIARDGGVYDGHVPYQTFPLFERDQSIAVRHEIGSFSEVAWLQNCRKIM